MPLMDFLNRPRAEGFAEQLGLIAGQLRLDGGVTGDSGYYRVWGGRALHMVTVRMEDAGVVVRAFSNVKFQPEGGLPPEVVTTLMRWKTPHRCMIWDGHTCEDWACFLMRCNVAPTSFAAQVLAGVIEDEVAEVSALDQKLIEAGYGWVETLQQYRPARPVVRHPQALPALDAPGPVQALVHKALDAASRLLGGR